MNAIALPPGPPSHWLAGHALRFRNDPLDALVEGMLTCGPVAHYSAVGHHVFQLNAPDAVQHMLVKHHERYRRSRNFDVLRLTLGNGLLTSDGKSWKRQRKLLQPVFVPHHVDGFAEAMTRIVEGLVDDWERRLARSKHTQGAATVDIHDEMMRLTLRVVGETLFSTDLDDHSSEVGRALSTVVRFTKQYAQLPLRPPLWLPLPHHLQFRRAKEELDGIVSQIVAERRRRREKPNDLLSHLMTAYEGRWPDPAAEAELHDQVMTLVLAGHETTANALTWTWHLLSQHPDADRRVALEVRETLGERRPCMADLDRFSFIERVLQESMRLYPPAWIIEREARVDDQIAGYRIPKGSTVLVAPYTLHRDPNHWENPEGFDPDRFLPERSTSRPRYAYLPFGAGPRVCIGKGFAMMEAKLVVAHIARRFRLELVPGQVVRPEPSVTLRPEGKVRMTLRPRAESQQPGEQTAKPQRSSGCPVQMVG